jgi:hypothetical protein
VSDHAARIIDCQVEIERNDAMIRGLRFLNREERDRLDQLVSEVLEMGEGEERDNAIRAMSSATVSRAVESGLNMRPAFTPTIVGQTELPRG